MTLPRKKEIPKEQLEIIGKISNLVKKLRKEKGLSVEGFCYQHRIPRITYSNLESGRYAFQITTLLTILAAHELSLGQFIEKLKK